jgi:hypothetical protein
MSGRTGWKPMLISLCAIRAAVASLGHAQYTTASPPRRDCTETRDEFRDREDPGTEAGEELLRI